MSLMTRSWWLACLLRAKSTLQASRGTLKKAILYTLTSSATCTARSWCGREPPVMLLLTLYRALRRALRRTPRRALFCAAQARGSLRGCAAACASDHCVRLTKYSPPGFGSRLRKNGASTFCLVLDPNAFEGPRSQHAVGLRPEFRSKILIWMP